MKRGWIIFGAFVTGGFSGGTAAWLFFRRKYRKLADEEIESVKSEFRKKYAKQEEPKPEPEVQEEPPKNDIPSPAQLEEEKAKTEARRQYEDQILREKYSGADYRKQFEILTQQQFDESDLPAKTIYYYVDGVLTFHGSLDKLSRQDLQLYIGCDALNRIAKCEDAMYVRNHRFNTDYEVIKQTISYKEALANAGR